MGCPHHGGTSGYGATPWETERAGDMIYREEFGVEKGALKDGQGTPGDICRNPLLPKPGDNGAGHGCWEALGAQTLQPEGQHVSTNHPECPFSIAWCHLRGRPRCWWFPGVLMGVSSVGARARGSPRLASGAGRKRFLGWNSATFTPPAVAWPWIHPPIFDPLLPP